MPDMGMMAPDAMLMGGMGAFPMGMFPGGPNMMPGMMPYGMPGMNAMGMMPGMGMMPFMYPGMMPQPGGAGPPDMQPRGPKGGGRGKGGGKDSKGGQDAGQKKKERKRGKKAAEESDDDGGKGDANRSANLVEVRKNQGSKGPPLSTLLAENNIIEFAGDQFGSKYLNGKLEGSQATPDEKMATIKALCRKQPASQATRLGIL